MAENYIKMKTELNRKKVKRKKFIKILMAFIVLISVLITLCLKLAYFNVEKIEVVNNKNLSKEEVVKISKISSGSNIFYINLKEIRTNLLSNSYIMDVNIKRNFPSKIIISVKERDAAFYIPKDNKFLIIGKDGVALEEKDTVENNKLIKLDGIDVKSAVAGKKLPVQDKRVIEFIGELTELFNLNISKYSMTSVNVSNLLNINIFYNNMCVKIGTPDNIRKKLNKAINVIDTQGLIDKKGYIDVSYEGNPVFCIEK